MPWMWPHDDDGTRMKCFRYWEPRVGHIIAKKQANWEYGRAVLRARAVGMTLTHIAHLLGMSHQRVRQIEIIAKRRGDIAPVESYLAQPFFFSIAPGKVILRPDERSTVPRLPRERREAIPRIRPIVYEPWKIEPERAWAILNRHSKIDPSSVRPNRRSCIVAWLWANGVSSLSAETDLALQQLWQDTSLSHKDAPELVEVEVKLCVPNGSRQKPKQRRRKQRHTPKPSLRTTADGELSRKIGS